MHRKSGIMGAHSQLSRQRDSIHLEGRKEGRKRGGGGQLKSVLVVESEVVQGGDVKRAPLAEIRALRLPLKRNNDSVSSS